MIQSLIQKPAFIAGAFAVVLVVVIGFALASRSDSEENGGDPPGNGDRVFEPAPIESLQIVVRDSSPPVYVAEIVAGLPNGCYERGDHQVERDGNTFVITVRNTVPRDLSAISCAAIYGTYNLSVELGSDLEVGETYTVDANGTKTSFDVAEDLPATVTPGDTPVSSDTPSAPGGSTVKPPAAGRMLVEAPIESVDVVVRESFPPQYGLSIVAGLPSGCAEAAGYEVSRAGDRIEVSVYNTLPSDPNVACTMIYGIYDLNVSLGTDFITGRTYTVDVNGTEITFTAQ
jgi:hypothetical protein